MEPTTTTVLAALLIDLLIEMTRYSLRLLKKWNKKKEKEKAANQNQKSES